MVAVALVAGCSSGDDSGSGGSTTTTDRAPSSQREVEAKLLTPADLASDDPLDVPWLVGDVSEGVDIVLPDCIDEELVEPAPTDGSAKLVSATDFKLPSLEQRLGAWTGDGAKAAFDAAVERLDGCDPQFTYQGTPSAGVIARLDLPPLGDESVAWRTVVTIAGAEVNITTIHVLVGDLEMSLVHTDITTPDPATLAEIAATAAAKL